MVSNDKVLASMREKTRRRSVIALNTSVEVFLDDYRLRVYFDALMHRWGVLRLKIVVFSWNHNARASSLKAGGEFPPGLGVGLGKGKQYPRSQL